MYASIILSTLAVFACALPAPPAPPAAPAPPAPASSNPLGLLGLIPKFIPAPRPGSCPLTSVTPPSSTLPAPNAGSKLVLVAVGRGTQNYTCATNDTTAIPVAVGAKANLYNASCVASKMSSSTLNSITKTLETVSQNNIPLQAVGMHYFTDPKTPVFSVNGFGDNFMNKTNSVNAPTNTNGDVAWLQLGDKAGATNQISQVYRLNTAGGSQPANCYGMNPAFQVQYAADYYFYTAS